MGEGGKAGGCEEGKGSVREEGKGGEGTPVCIFIFSLE